MTEPVISSADLDAIRALFLRQAAGESSQSIEAIDAVLARAAPGQPDPVAFVARAYRFSGREAVLEHFRTVFKGTWRFEPDLSSIKITPINAETAHIYADLDHARTRRGARSDLCLPGERNRGPHAGRLAHRDDRSGVGAIGIRCPTAAMRIGMY